jgi:hypothetical protein
MPPITNSRTLLHGFMSYLSAEGAKRSVRARGTAQALLAGNCNGGLNPSPRQKHVPTRMLARPGGSGLFLPLGCGPPLDLGVAFPNRLR